MARTPLVILIAFIAFILGRTPVLDLRPHNIFWLAIMLVVSIVVFAIGEENEW